MSRLHAGGSAVTALAGALSLLGAGCPGGGTTDAGGATDAAAPDAATDAGPQALPGTCLAPPTAACVPGTGARPGRRSEFSAVYDEAGRRMVVFGGTSAIPVMCGFPTPDFLDETWIYDDQCATWRLSAGAGPGGRNRHMAAYDSVNRRMLVFGGRFRAGASGAYTLYNDLWALDLAAETWTQLSAGGAGAPPARSAGVVAFDPSGSGRLWLFGGNASTSGASYTALDDTWSYDLATGAWTQAPAATRPPARLLHSAGFDTVRGRLFVFGGADETAFDPTAAYFADVWGFDTAAGTWAELHDGSGTAPDGRFFGAIAYDETGDRYLAFGGHDDTALGNANDLWGFDPGGGVWTLLLRGDTFNEPIPGFCDPTINFAVVDPAAPERRNAHGWVVSATCGHALTFGGKTDCGATDDVWAWELAAGGWTEAVEATEGEVCLRRRDGDPTNCQNLCL